MTNRPRVPIEPDRTYVEDMTKPVQIDPPEDPEVAAKRAAILEGIASADAGEVIPYEDVRRWLLFWGNENEAPPLVEEREAKLQTLQEILNASIARGGSHTWEEVAVAVKARLASLPSAEHQDL